MALLSIHDVNLAVANTQLLDNVSLHIERGERVCLLGRNGAGKSTIMKMMSGGITPDSGTLSFASGARVAYVAQEVPEGISGYVYDIAADTESGADVEPHQVDAVLTRLGLDGNVEFSTLSGGLKRRVMLARALVSEPDLLLLDEPTNHLDVESITWLEDRLQKYVRTVLFVTHDRAFLRKLATRIVEIDRGHLSSWSCDYDTYLERKAAMLEAEAKQNQNFDRKMAEEEVWIRKGVKARTTRNEGRVRALQKMREERKARREVSGTVRMTAQDTDRSGHVVIETKNASYSYPNEDGSLGEPIVRDFSTLILRGDKVGIIGANGAGKTTLLRMMLDQLQPQEGTAKLGTRLQIAYFDQLRAGLDEDATVQQNVAGENDTVLVNGVRRHIVGYLQEFLFSPERARTRVSVLSGGERNRLLLAKLFTQPANLLVMDEPTNDLDMETLDLLEDLLVNFPGTLLLVSHDRSFLNDVVTSTIAPIGNGLWREYVGGYDDWLRQSGQEALQAERSNAAAKPKTPKAGMQPVGKPSSGPRKISFKEAKELEGLPAQIEALETEHAALVEKMADPDFYKGDPSAPVESKKRLEAIESELVKIFARWEQLEKLSTG